MPEVKVKYTRMVAIKKFFESDGGRTVTMPEMTALSDEEKTELGRLSAEALGGVLDEGK